MRMTKTKRIAALEKAIKNTINTYGIKLITGDYVRNWSGRDDDICGCAIGAAILSTAKDKEKLKDLIYRVKPLSIYEVGDVALEIVNDGITKEDLIDFEAGYEGWSMSEAPAKGIFSDILQLNKKKIRKNSLFYKAGVRLAKQRDKQNRK